MTTCRHCGHTISAGQLLCAHCQRPQTPANHYTAIVSLSLIGLAVGVMFAYWALSQLVWLPFTQPLFYLVAESFGLAYTTTNLESHTFFNAPWLVGGALLYIPLITYAALRRGFKQTLVAALFGSLPFAFLDHWAWSAANRPGLTQIIIVFIITTVILTVLHFLFIYLSDRWPPRLTLIQTQAIKPTTRQPDPQPVENQEPSPPQPEPKPLPRSGVNESTPPKQPIEIDHDPPARQGGIPAWIIVVGLGILILIGIVLIFYAL